MNSRKDCSSIALAALPGHSRKKPVKIGKERLRLNIIAIVHAIMRSIKRVDFELFYTTDPRNTDRPKHETCDKTVRVYKKLTIDNLQNYCLGTRYGARLRSRLCRRLSISLVRYRHGLEKFLEHHFIPIRRRFNSHDLPTDLLRVQDPFFFGEEGRSFRQETSMAWHGLFLCGRSSLI